MQQMRRLQRTGAIVVTAVLGLGLVACGGSDDAASPTTTSTTDEGTTDTTDGGSLGDFSAECADFVSAFAGAGSVMGSAFSGADDEVRKAAAYFDDVADKLPKEIRADFAVFAAAYKEFAQALVDADIDFSDPAKIDQDKLAELEGLAEAFDSPKVKQASDNIQAYVDESCKGG